MITLIRSPRHGSILLLVLLILGVSVMLAGTFVSMMATYQASGVRQSARQIAAQTALAGVIYAEQVLLSDHLESQNSNIPQRYNNVVYTTPYKGPPDSYAGKIPATPTERIGLNWKFPFEGRINALDGVWKVGPAMTQVQYRDNQYGWSNYYGYFQGLRTDATRPTYVDSMDGTQAVALQYAAWSGTWYSIDGNSTDYGALAKEMIYRTSMLTSPRWLTVGYYDRDYQPLEYADRDLAAYEARFSVVPIPLDGCLSINVGDKILSRTDGGRFRLGRRNPNIPPGTLELSAGIIASAEGSAKGTFAQDAQDFDEGKKGALSYKVGDTCSVGVSAAYPYQAYLLEPTDTDWVGAGYPLAQQYGTAFANMLGVMVVTDGSSSINVRKDSNVVFTGMPAVPPTKYSAYTVTASAVKTGGLFKATAGIGTLSKISEIVMGQGYNGNFQGYSNAGIGDIWADPTVKPQLQVGTAASWRQFHANLGYARPSTGVGYDDAVTAGDRILQIMSLVCTPFGAGLDTAQIPVRNLGSKDQADIDCPWYVNIMLANNDTAHVMMCAMTPEWYSNFDNKNGNTGDSSGYPLNQSKMLPIPPDKPCPTRGAAYGAKWDDGVARTGADGVEGGALPPLDSSMGYVLTTGYKRPPVSNGDSGYYFEHDAFAGNAPLVWKNPVRDELIWPNGSLAYRADPYTIPSGATPWYLRDNVAYGLRGMTGSNPKPAQIVSKEDQVGSVVVGGGGEQAHAFENFPKGAEKNLDDNTDPADERLSWQDDVIAALMKAVVDCHFDRMHGLKLNPLTTHGYTKIEDVETVFLAHLGISVKYLPAESRASTVAISPADYQIYAGPPATADPPGGTWPLGKMNQLWALSQIISEIGTDRSNSTTPDAVDNTNTDGVAGQRGYRHYHNKVALRADNTYPAGWPTGYQPTWAALSRILEHRLNDVRMSLFGTPALDFNQDGFVDATTNDGTGVVVSQALGAANAQLHFSSTGRWQIGRNRFWRIWVKAELWDRRDYHIASESALEQVIVMDPDGDGRHDDDRTLFRRWHGNYATSGRNGPTKAGRTEAELP